MIRMTQVGRGFAAAGALAMLSGAPAEGATVKTFDHTGAAQTWTVPDGVTEATFTLYGASGGDGGGTWPRGFGGSVTATISVTPGETLQINVGGAGAQGNPNGAGGFNGGGSSCGSAGSGGGASDVRRDTDSNATFELGERLIVAGGGGGAGWAAGILRGGLGGTGGGEIGGSGTASSVRPRSGRGDGRCGRASTLREPRASGPSPSANCHHDAFAVSM